LERRQVAGEVAVGQVEQVTEGDEVDALRVTRRAENPEPRGLVDDGVETGGGVAHERPTLIPIAAMPIPKTISATPAVAPSSSRPSPTAPVRTAARASAGSPTSKAATATTAVTPTISAFAPTTIAMTTAIRPDPARRARVRVEGTTPRRRCRR